MTWLWVFPIFASALFDDNRHRRIGWLVYYSLVVGAILGGVNADKLASQGVGIVEFLAGAVLYGPFIFILSWAIEWFAQRIFRKVRRFEINDKCRKCGYCIRHLAEPRCPECGEPFDQRLLELLSIPPQPTQPPRQTWRAFALLVGLCLATPFLYHERALWASAARGRADAQRDWDTGNAAILLSPKEALAWPGYKYDLATGLQRRITESGSIEYDAYQEAYKVAIDAKLHEFGPPERPPNVLSPADLNALLASNRLQNIEQFPFYSPNNLVFEKTESSQSIQAGHVAMAWHHEAITPIAYAELPERNNIAIVRTAGCVYTFDHEGNLLQWARIQDAQIADMSP